MHMYDADCDCTLCVAQTQLDKYEFLAEMARQNLGFHKLLEAAWRLGITVSEEAQRELIRSIRWSRQVPTIEQFINKLQGL